MIDWTIFLSVFAALIAYTFIRSVVHWFYGRLHARANRYTELVDWWVNQRTAVLVEDGVGETEANEQAAYDLSRLRFWAHLSELFKNVWEFASMIFALILLFLLYRFVQTQDFDEVVQLLGRFVSKLGLLFALWTMAYAGLTTALHWRSTIVADLEKQKDPTWTDSPKLVKWWTNALHDLRKRRHRATGLHRLALRAMFGVIGLAWALAYIVLWVGALLYVAWYLGFFPTSS